MKKKHPKKEVEKKIGEFFDSVQKKEAREIKKIKKIAMSYNIALKEKRKLFCKKCLTPYKFPKIRTKNNIKSVECDNCRNISRWRIK